MTDVDLLNAHLDANPGDQNARLALADAIRESGGNGDGCEALARMGIWPDGSKYKEGYWIIDDGFRYVEKFGVPISQMLPNDWFEIADETDSVHWNGIWIRHDLRRELEDSICSVFTMLPVDKQRQYLSGVRDKPETKRKKGC